MKGKQIHDNIVVVSEVFHFLKLKKKRKRYMMALKVDMNKAYDRVEWNFLRVVMKKLGVDGKWIMECISSVFFNIIINGKVSNNFSPSRGLRKRDHLSLYLFLFVSDILSRMIKSYIEYGSLSGMKLSRNCPVLSHLFLQMILFSSSLLMVPVLTA